VVGVSETRFLEETWFLGTLSTLKCSATSDCNLPQNSHTD